MIRHYQFRLNAKPRGYHLVTNEILAALAPLPNNGLISVFIKHTSAALTINENADPSVREDFESIINSIIPENLPFLKHTLEGPDDMPAHIKAAFIGSSISIPIIEGELALGTWQGIYLCEFRNHGGSRSLIASVYE